MIESGVKGAISGFAKDGRRGVLRGAIKGVVKSSITGEIEDFTNSIDENSEHLKH